MLEGLDVGAELRRQEVHARFGGRRQGGISPSSSTPVVMFFTDPATGHRHGYLTAKHALLPVTGRITMARPMRSSTPYGERTFPSDIFQLVPGDDRTADSSPLRRVSHYQSHLQRIASEATQQSVSGWHQNGHENTPANSRLT